MPNLEKRITMLEQAARPLAAQAKPHTPHLTVEDFQKIMHEIKTRERPQLTQEEQIQKAREGVERMMQNWASRAGR